MLGRLMVIIMLPLILYLTIYPGLKTAADGIVNCNASAFTNGSSLATILQPSQSPPGETQSFGGAGGTYRFGGYNGIVTHDNFVKRVKNESACYGLDESQKSIISMAPVMFLIASGIVSYFFYRNFYYSFIGCDDI